MAVPNIVAFRIDERLIHGQGQLWIKALGVNTVIVANDSASEDSMQQTLMKAVVPKTIAMRGGTDGSYISTQKIMTPNYFTGGMNFHSRFEFLPVSSFVKSYEMTMKLLELIVKNA